MDLSAADFVMGLVLGAIAGGVLVEWVRQWLENAEDEPEWHRSQLPYDGVADPD